MKKNASFFGMIISLLMIIFTFIMIPINLNLIEDMLNSHGYSLDSTYVNMEPLIKSTIMSLLIFTFLFIGGYLGSYKESNIGRTMVFLMGIFSFFGMFIYLEPIELPGYAFILPMCYHLYYISNIILLFIGISAFPLQQIKSDFNLYQKIKNEIEEELN
ncbi:MAG: hypothetical protein JXA99_13980 [Candidatus Lokiarchaeota archaeon]|nr:hypothetical protein [Candidatus Lokiarchaeota archaeon]